MEAVRKFLIETLLQLYRSSCVERDLEEDTIVGVIEVMKLMNSVQAGVKGEVVEILAVNGAPIEYGEILMRVRPEA